MLQQSILHLYCSNLVLYYLKGGRSQTMSEVLFFLNSKLLVQVWFLHGQTASLIQLPLPQTKLIGNNFTNNKFLLFQGLEKLNLNIKLLPYLVSEFGQDFILNFIEIGKEHCLMYSKSKIRHQIKRMVVINSECAGCVIFIKSVKCSTFHAKVLKHIILRMGQI